MTAEVLAAVVIAAAFVALLVLLDRCADALRAKYLGRLPPGGLLGHLWRKLTRSSDNNSGG